jgi:hypothetical protein
MPRQYAARPVLVGKRASQTPRLLGFYGRPAPDTA